GKPDITELQGVAAMVGVHGPTFGERRLDLLRDLVDAHELGLRENRAQLGRPIAVLEAIERQRIRPDRHHDLAAARWRRLSRFGPRRTSVGRGLRSARDRSCRDGREDDGTERPNDARLSGQKLARRPKTWPIKIVCSAAVIIDFACKFSGIPDDYEHVGQLFGQPPPPTDRLPFPILVQQLSRSQGLSYRIADRRHTPDTWYLPCLYRCAEGEDHDGTDRPRRDARGLGLRTT